MRTILKITVLGLIAIVAQAQEEETHHHHHHHHHDIDVQKMDGEDESTHTPSNVQGGCTLGNVIWNGAGNCQTSYIEGLSRQIADEMGALGVRFASLQGHGGIDWSGCSGFMNADALSSLDRLTSQHGQIRLSSAWRSAAAQYLLYCFKVYGRCGQTLPVAKPGTSNHEGGVAIDVPNHGYWQPILTSNGWRYPLPSADPVHFEFGSGASEYARKNLLAFQRLWNRHNPGRRIAEDGIYGHDTAGALFDSPCNGW
ncbi:hypothetical protein FGO68_gene15920 [Halteria grandinella]|uniref:Uncharacterized protein n=1 Tax=Halteria grandinella TaxID=5974 RepID=A0A8J8SZ81_HALGN|nr:hypothetical protein FGO68_gene15920 [Halteria grandinella]